MAVDWEKSYSFNEYDLYNKKIEDFFLENYVSKKTYH